MAPDKKQETIDNFHSSVMQSSLVLFGADYGARTRHLDLGKVALYQMSYARKRKVDYSV